MGVRFKMTLREAVEGTEYIIKAIETDDEDPEKETAMNRSSAKDRLVFPDCQQVGYASGDIPDNQKEEAEVKG